MARDRPVLTGAKARLDDDGNYHISLSGLSLVLGREAKTLSFDPATDVITHDASGVAVTLSGEVGGRQQFLVEDVPAIITGLGALTVDLADTLNAQHALGFSGPGAPGGALFTYNPINPAESIAVAITAA